MKVMRLDDLPDFLKAELGMDVSESWVRKQCEPDANGKRRLPVFRLTDGATAPFYTTDEAILAHFRMMADSALRDLHGEAGLLAKFLHPENRAISQSEGKEGIKAPHTGQGRAGWRGAKSA